MENRPQISKKSRGSADSGARMREMETLLSISRTVAAMETVDEVLRTLVEIVIRETGSERGSLFLNDKQTGELYSRVALGDHMREIRILNTSGIAGQAFTTGEGLTIHDAHADPRFNAEVDEQTGFVTRNIMCAPIKTGSGEIIGVVQALNKEKGRFTKRDLGFLVAMTTQAATTLQSTQMVENMRRDRATEMQFLDVVSDVTAEIDLGALLQKVMSEATAMLKAERSTLFLNDEKTNELFSRVAQGDSIGEIRLPNHLGIAGAVFTSGNTVNIPHAYADLRFNPAFDKQTGFFTRSMLCVPVVNKSGKVIGVTQVLNKRGGPFTGEGESRLKAFTAQVSIALENAKLFDDVQTMKNYNESMLESMSNGVITMDDEGVIVTCNTAGLHILKVDESAIIGASAKDLFAGANAWILEKIDTVNESQEQEIFMDADVEVPGDEEKNYNESMLESMSNGVITMDDEGVIVTCNTAGLHILKVDESAIIGASAKDLFAGANAWILEKIDTVNESQEQEIFMDADVEVPGDEEDDPAETVSANITILPLVNETDQQKKIGRAAHDRRHQL